ncbi:MAG: GNAT family N-acetyltransferase [Pirellula sp.]|nr:GNAT family N-acetyltransferase [Pirellula sp.]
MTNVAICIKTYKELPEWDEFVESHPQGSIFHSSSMIRVEESTKQHAPYAIGAVDSNGAICAALVAVRVSTLDGLGSQLSTRSLMYAEPIALDSEIGRLGILSLIQRHDEDMFRKALFSEVRPNFSNSVAANSLIQCGYERCGYLNYELAINRSETDLFRNMSPKRRNNVRSAIRRGVSVKELELPDGIETLYRLISTSYKRSKVPLADSSLFYSVANHLDADRVRLLVAYCDGEPVSAACFLAYKERVVCWYAGTLRIPGVHSMTLVFWEAIKRFSQDGYSVFDLAGAGWEGEEYGPGKFKSKFGGTETNHGRYRKVYSPWKLMAANTAYQLIRRLDIYPGPTSFKQ